MQAQNSELDRQCKEMQAQNSELDRQCKEMNAQNEELNRQLLQKEIEISNKQSHLMSMSDWAYQMKLRLEDLDKSRIIRIMERINRNRLKFLQSLESVGIKETSKKVIKKILKKITQMFIKNLYKPRENKYLFSQLKQSIQKNNGKIIIALPIITWNSRWQRPQQILSRFAKDGYTIIYMSMGIQPRGYIYRNEEEAWQGFSISLLEDNIYKLWLSSEKPINIYIDKINEGNLQNFYFEICSLLRKLKIKKMFYLVQFPGWTPLAIKLKESIGGKILFDCMDEHSGFSTNSTEVLNNEKILLEKSDLVIASSRILEEKVKKYNKNTILVQNGTEFEHFNKIKPNGELEHLKKAPIIGYYGAISDWFDIELVEYVATQRPNWNFVLIGSTLGCNTVQVEKLQNVYFLGEKPYNSLPGYLYYFDVCIIPFKIIPLTLATNPVKFYEFLSCGKPVVAVCLPELEPYKNLCYFIS
jgi:glycosyltransferase involved in cell wall biosynthesis